MDRSTFRPSPPAPVEATREDDGWTLVLTRELRHSPERVWAALTEPDQLREWAPFVPDRDLGLAGDATLTMVDGATTDDVASTVLRAEPPRLLEYTWGFDLLRWELAAQGAGTLLTLRHRVGDPEMLARVAAGWHLCLDVAEHLLDGDPVGPIRGMEAVEFGWNDLHDAYVRMLKER
ncbi:SRPBCC family protein [Actinopolymorpha sp. NPDC004070]|uniref:SRPBCC family protein n=1 Tax=Actinopolymorpha sp. NPDC004070 TaxID=3154548 RepID=UPI0033B4C479